MTAPDPGLTDLKQILLQKIQTDHEPAGWSMPDVPIVERIAEALREMATAATKADGQLWGAFPNTMTISDLAAHLALVVEQHTNGRIAELEASTRESVRVLVMERHRAEKAEVTIARVITALEAAEKSVPDDWGVTYIYTPQLRAALEGEQQ